MLPTARFSLAAVAALALTAFSSPLAAQTIDQQQTGSSVCMSGLWNLDLAQSFTAQGLNSVGGGFRMHDSGGSTENVTISLWDDLPPQGGTMLASGSALATRGQWVDVFWNPVDITPGNEYFLIIEGTSLSLCVGGEASDQYPGGHVYTNAGFQPFPAFDFAFRAFSNTDPILNLIDVNPGSFMTFEIQGIAQDATVITLVSLNGNGPTSSPFGDLAVTAPFLMTPAFPPNAQGIVSFTSTMPPSLSGETLSMHAIEFETGGVTELSNPLVFAVP